MEQKTWWKAITYPARIDYVSFQYNELVFVLAVEKLLELEVPREGDVDADAARRAEPDPLASRLARHVRARARSDLDVLVLLPRARPDARPLRDGHRRADAHALLPGRRARRGHPAAASIAEARKFCERMPKAVDEYEAILNANQIWLERTKGVGLLSRGRRDRARPVGARTCAPPGVDWDLRRREPYLAYDQVDFDVPVYHGGDVYDRYKVRVDEMRESTRIVAQCLDRLEEMQGEPWIADDRKVVLPPREELHTSMESLIHHFKIVTEGYRVPGGRGLRRDRVAARRARLLPRLRRRPEAVARQVPRAVVRRAAGDRDLHDATRRRRPDRDRRLARRGHGRGRPVSARALYDEIQEVRRAVPAARARRRCRRCGSRRSSYGWLPPEAFREVADALDETPAYCMAVASFYDMFHLEPVGRHLVEVCTNLSCALVGAQQVLEAFESELGVRAGRDDRGRRGHAAHGRVRSAAAAGPPSSRSTTATASTSSPATCPGSSRSSAAWLSSSAYARPRRRRRAAT